MKNKKGFLLLVLILSAIFLCCGCTPSLEEMDNPDVRQRTETMLDALITDDIAAGHALVSDRCTLADFTPGFRQMQEFLGDPDSYELKLRYISVNRRYTDGQTLETVDAAYEMTTPSDRIVVSIQTFGPEQHLGSFYLTPYENTDYFYTGTLDTMQDASLLQWLFLLSNILPLGIALYALADCLRRPMKKKLLWIMFLLLGFLTVGSTISSGGFRLNMNINLIAAYTALVRYGSGTMTIRIMLPLGAIVYFSHRRKLIRRDSSEPVAETIPEEAPSMQAQIPESSQESGE